MPKPKNIDYASLFTLRKDGLYMGYWRDANRVRHAMYDRDPEKLYEKLKDAGSVSDDRHVMFGDVAEEWEGYYRETVTVRSWLNLKPHYEDIKSMYKGLAIGEVTAADINRDYLRGKARGLSRTVVNNRRVIYNGIFNFAIVNGYITQNPAVSVKLPKGLKQGRRSAPTDEQIKAICSNTDKPFGIFPFLLLCTGLRKSEALALLKSDIDFKAKTISVTKALIYTDNANPSVKEPKTESGRRVVPIISALYAQLKAYCAGVKSDYLFPQAKSNRGGGKGSGYMTERGYEGSWERYCIAAGLADAEGKPTLTAHQLRHGTATLLFESDVDPYTAQHILGHANVQTTMTIYTELRQKQMAKSISKFDAALSKLKAK